MEANFSYYALKKYFYGTELIRAISNWNSSQRFWIRESSCFRRLLLTLLFPDCPDSNLRFAASNMLFNYVT